MSATSRDDVAPLMATTELATRLVAAERRCIQDWLLALADEPGDPFRIRIAEIGATTALACWAVPAEILNRVFELTQADIERIPEILAFYDAHGAAPTFDLNPYTVTGFWQQPNVTSALARHGLHHGHSTTCSLGERPPTSRPRLPG